MFSLWLEARDSCGHSRGRCRRRPAGKRGVKHDFGGGWQPPDYRSRVAARRRRSLIARPSSRSGTGMAAIRANPRASPSVSSCRNPANSRAAASATSPCRSAGRLQPAPGSGGPNASSASSLPHVRRLQPHRQPRRVVRGQHSRRAQRAVRVSLGRADRSDDRLDRFHRRAARTAATRDPLADRSSTVDSTPTWQAPLSSTAAMRPARSRHHMRAVVGLTWPETVG